MALMRVIKMPTWRLADPFYPHLRHHLSQTVTLIDHLQSSRPRNGLPDGTTVPFVYLSATTAAAVHNVSSLFFLRPDLRSESGYWYIMAGMGVFGLLIPAAQLRIVFVLFALLSLLLYRTTLFRLFSSTMSSVPTRAQLLMPARNRHAIHLLTLLGFLRLRLLNRLLFLPLALR